MTTTVEVREVRSNYLDRAIVRAKELGWRGRFLELGTYSHRDRLDELNERISPAISMLPGDLQQETRDYINLAELFAIGSQESRDNFNAPSGFVRNLGFDQGKWNQALNLVVLGYNRLRDEPVDQKVTFDVHPGSLQLMPSGYKERLVEAAVNRGATYDEKSDRLALNTSLSEMVKQVAHSHGG